MKAKSGVGGLIGFIALVLAAGPVAAEPIVQSATSSMRFEVTRTEDGFQAVVHDKRAWFELASAEFDCSWEPVLLKFETQVTSGPLGMESYFEVDQVTMTASHVTESSALKPLYTLTLKPEGEEQGSEHESIDAFVDSGRLAVRLGHEFAPYRIYDLASGQFLLPSDDSHTVASIYVDGDCSRNRYVSISNSGPLSDGPAHRLLAHLNYASPKGLRQAVRIRVTEEAWRALGVPRSDETFIPRLSVSVGRIPLRANDQATFDRIKIKLRLTDDVVIEVPIAHDTLDLAGAVLPPGFAISAVE